MYSKLFTLSRAVMLCVECLFFGTITWALISAPDGMFVISLAQTLVAGILTAKEKYSVGEKIFTYIILAIIPLWCLCNSFILIYFLNFQLFPSLLLTVMSFSLFAYLIGLIRGELTLQEELKYVPIRLVE
jgi:hypothetical protein